jgi:hypothetical protein
VPQRRHILSTRCSEAEAAVIIAAAAVQGMILSDWLRATLHGEAIRVMGRHVAPKRSEPSSDRA